MTVYSFYETYDEDNYWLKVKSLVTSSVQDVMAFNSAAESQLPFPIIADDKRELAVKLGMLDPDELDKDGIPLTARCVRILNFFFLQILIFL